jgi:serine protease AprX
MAVNVENPILLVQPRKQDLKQRVIEGFGEPKEIVDVTPAFRKALVGRIDKSAQALQHTFVNYPSIPAVVVLRLHVDAMAKSHRPMLLLERVGMRPIGTRRFGELLLPATANSLKNLANIAENNDAKAIRANLSTIDEIFPWDINDTLGWNGIDDGDAEAVKQSLTGWVQASKPLLLERFASEDQATDIALKEVVRQTIQQINVRVRAETSAAGGAAMFVQASSLDAAMTLAACPAVRRLVPADEFSPIEVRPQMFATIGPAPDELLPPPEVDLPVVAVVDSGIPKNDQALKPWIAAQETFVLPPDTDYLHGTFVAGLIAGGRLLNGNDAQFPAARSRVLDVATLSTGLTSADELLLNIETAIKAHPEVKVWNCSFGSKSPGHPELFGQFAQDLDILSDRYGVLFVVSAGNYESPPLRSWPPSANLGGMDRISQPAEALRALTVGSIAHRPALVQPNEPSPFSRRGPGAARTPKPDVTHRGGNCTAVGAFVGSGVRSFLPGGQIGESVGTSFSTPLVSTLAANVWQTLDRHHVTASPETVKALMIHAAALSSPLRNADERDYYGFGVPDSVLKVLFCSPQTFTLMFEAELYDGIFWEKTPFPIPECLHPDGDHLRAEVFMTLVYSPPLDGKHGAEYVRANVDASFGTYDPDEEGELHHHGLVPLEAPRREDLYEKAMVDHGFKWSPVKVYHGRFTRGKAGRNFRLKLELLRRAGESPQREPQRATVIISFRSIDDNQPVYADGIRALRRVNWVTQALATQAQLRV